MAKLGSPKDTDVYDETRHRDFPFSTPPRPPRPRDSFFLFPDKRNYLAARACFEYVLSIQDKRLETNDPAIADTLMSMALCISEVSWCVSKQGR